MTDCHQIDSLVTSYVDDDISAGDRDVVDRHLDKCRLCRGRVHGEKAVQALIHARRPALHTVAPSPMLRARCAALARPTLTDAAGSAAWRVRVVPFALAASLALFVGGALVYELTERSAGVLAAELTADHVKCFRLMNNVFDARRDQAGVESAMESGFQWHVRLPDHAESAGLELVGARPCLYGEGLAAHIMYRHHGNPVSLFMLPQGARRAEVVAIMGHQAAIWSVDQRTFVLVAREPPAEVERMRLFVQAAMR
jgi:anti-sigma factor RsiW